MNEEEGAVEIAERLLMDAPHYDHDTRIVATDDILRLVQLLRGALEDLGGVAKTQLDDTVTQNSAPRADPEVVDR